MKLPAGLPSLLLLAAGGLLLLRINGCYQRRDGILIEQGRALRHENDSLRTAGRGLDTVYLRRTDTLLITRHRTDSILATDTILVADSVRVLIGEERNACDALLRTCEAQKANLRSQIGNIQAQLDVANKRRPGFFRRTFACTVGPTVTRRGFDVVGASCGLRL